MITGSFNVGGWTTGSSIISLGLNVWQAMLAIIVANLFAALMCVLSGHPGAKWHIAFPQWMRQIWGVHGYLVPMAVRVFLSFVWISTNTWYGGQCLKVFFTCLWPSYANLNSSMAGGTMDTGDFLAFVIFILSCLPLMWFSPENYKKPFLLGSITVATTVFVLLIWSVVRAGGGGALLHNTSSAAGVEPARGSALGWAFVSAIMANIGSIATHMFSQTDYTRYARRPGDQVFAQLIIVPVGTITVACIGIVCTSTAYTLYPQLEALPWSPYIYLDAIRRYEDTASARAGVAFASLAFVVSQYGMVVASNAVVAGIDLAAILPRWFTLRRGGYFTILFAFIMQPWRLLNGASSFLTVVGSFNVFLGPFMGILFVDFYLLRKRSMKLLDIYDESPASLYWYSSGLNWRAAAAWPVGFWFLLPGLAQRAIETEVAWVGWTQLYDISWFLGAIVSGVCYFVFDRVWPMPGKLEKDDADYFSTDGLALVPSLDGGSAPDSTTLSLPWSSDKVTAAEHKVPIVSQLDKADP